MSLCGATLKVDQSTTPRQHAFSCRCAVWARQQAAGGGAGGTVTTSGGPTAYLIDRSIDNIGCPPTSKYDPCTSAPLSPPPPNSPLQFLAQQQPLGEQHRPSFIASPSSRYPTLVSWTFFVASDHSPSCSLISRSSMLTTCSTAAEPSTAHSYHPNSMTSCGAQSTGPPGLSFTFLILWFSHTELSRGAPCSATTASCMPR